MSSEKNEKKKRGKKSSDFIQPCGARGDISNPFHLLSIDASKNEIGSVEERSSKILYYGWFFGPKESLLIKEIAYAYLNDIIENVHPFKNFMKECCKLHEIQDVQQYYKKSSKRQNTENTNELKYHVTAKFLDRKPNPYYSSLAQPFIGKRFRIHIVGIYFTKKTFGVRVKLTTAQKILFDEREGSTSRVGVPTKLSKPEPCEADVKRFQKALKAELKSYESTLKPTAPACKSFLHSGFPKKGVALEPCDLTNFKPSSSRAHSTIGCGPHVKAIQAGIDLLDIIDLESQVDSSATVFHKDYPIDGGTLRQFEQLNGDAFVIYPCHGIVAEATFDHL